MRWGIPVLVFWYLLGTIFLILTFATLYASTGGVVDDAGAQQGFWSCLYQKFAEDHGREPVGECQKLKMNLFLS